MKDADDDAKVPFRDAQIVVELTDGCEEFDINETWDAAFAAMRKHSLKTQYVPGKYVMSIQRMVEAAEE